MYISYFQHACVHLLVLLLYVNIYIYIYTYICGNENLCSIKRSEYFDYLLLLASEI